MIRTWGCSSSISPATRNVPTSIFKQRGQVVRCTVLHTKTYRRGATPGADHTISKFGLWSKTIFCTILWPITEVQVFCTIRRKYTFFKFQKYIPIPTYSNLDCCSASIHNFKFDTTTTMAVTTAVVSSMAIAVTATAIATTAADTQHAAIMNEMLSAMGTEKTVETIATEGKW